MLAPITVRCGNYTVITPLIGSEEAIPNFHHRKRVDISSTPSRNLYVFLNFIVHSLYLLTS